MVVVERDPEVLGVLAAPSRKRRSNTVDCIGRTRHPLRIAVLFFFFIEKVTINAVTCLTRVIQNQSGEISNFIY